MGMTTKTQRISDLKRAGFAPLGLCGLLFALVGFVFTADAAQFTVEQMLEVAKVPAGFPVRFCLLTGEHRQYVAYYDKDRQMTVASRTLDSDQWQVQTLPSKIKWDSHNYVTKTYWDLYDPAAIILADNRYKPKNAPKALRGSGGIHSYGDRNMLKLTSEKGRQ